MVWWGGWLLVNYPDHYNFRDFLVAMFAMLFSLTGLAMAASDAASGEKAKPAAARIFEIIDRNSTIDPLSNQGKKGI